MRSCAAVGIRVDAELWYPQSSNLSLSVRQKAATLSSGRSPVDLAEEAALVACLVRDRHARHLDLVPVAPALRPQAACQIGCHS